MSTRLARFHSATGWDAWRVFGARTATERGVKGVRFRVWAPRARHVELIGDFNDWQPAAMAPMGADASVWQLFVAGAGELQRYKYRVHAAGRPFDKADPFAFATELRPATASVVYTSQYRWSDGEWLERRRRWRPSASPISIYELHLGSWLRHRDGAMYSYRDVADRLIAHVKRLGFTHVEFLPLSEHPYDPSWGYQVTGYFAPTARHGSPDDLRWLIDALHGAGIGVIVDWVPAHFPRDEHGLPSFDGAPLYEYADPQRGEHPDWGTLCFDLARPEVRSFLLASACYWIETLHVDALRVDAVASMIYLDYSRSEGQWTANEFGGNHHLEAISFLQDLNRTIRARFPGVVMIAEESTSFPHVSGPPPPPFSPPDAGLGFHFKWNMGWMHDTLGYFREDPVHRLHHHGKLTFSMMYAFAEAFVLPLSHDEVVHGKGSLVRKMAGDWRDGLAQLRVLFALQWTWPGKKLLFAGCELAQDAEWDFDSEVDWAGLNDEARAGLVAWIGDLNRLYRTRPALHRGDCDERGFVWLDPDDNDRSIASYVRHDPDGDGEIAVFLSFTPVAHADVATRLSGDRKWRRVAGDGSWRAGPSTVSLPGFGVLILEAS